MIRFANPFQALLQVAVGLCCLVVAIGSVDAQEPLVWKFTVGEEQNYQMVQKIETTVNAGPTGEITTTVQQTVDMTWKVETVEENGTSVLTQQIRRIQMDVSIPNQADVHYDTQSDDEPQGFAAMISPVLQALASATFQVTMTPRGEITDIEIPESLVEAMSKAPGGAMMGELASEKGLKNLVQQSFLTLPEPDDLVPGHEWTKTADMENPTVGKITTQTTYRYEGPREIDGKSFEVFAPTITIDFGGEGSMIEVVEQESSGEILFSRSAGRIESSTLDQQMHMRITMGDQTLDQKIKQTVEFKLVPEGTSE